MLDQITRYRRGLGDPGRVARLAAWLRDELLVDWVEVEFARLSRTSGGVSYETWIADLFDPSSPGQRRRRIVIRREPLRGPVEPYDVLNEAATIAGLQGTGVPVPTVLAGCDDTSILDRPFTVLEYVDGEIPDYRTIASTPGWSDPAQRAAMADEFIRVLAELQRVDPRRLAHLADTPMPLRSERARLHYLIDDMLASAERRMQGWTLHPIFRDAAWWCKRNALDGEPSGMVVVHGDYKLGNFIWREGRIVAALDWEGAMIGDPLQDLGYACHPAMREAQPSLMAMLAPHAQIVELYQRHTGRRVDLKRMHYYVVYALLFHTWTLMVGIPSIVEWDGDMRMATGYGKLNQVTRLLVDEIEAYEAGRHVL